jgi:competence protein ComEC
MWRHLGWRKRFKWTWSVVVPLVWLLVVVAGVFGEEPEDKELVVGNPGPTATLMSTTIATSPTPTTTPPSSAAEEAASEAAAAATPEAVNTALPSVSASPGLLLVYFFDVSLGDAIYIRTPTGEDVVIDGGDSRSELSAFLDALGETALDVVVASHPHADHIGGLPQVVTERQVASVWTNGQTYTTNIYRDLEAAIASSGAVKHVGTPGATFTVGGVLFTVLAPVNVGSNINDNSLVVRMDCGESSFLFTGDAETSSENEMIVLNRNLDVDVLKLGHHGSRTSTSMQLILAISPKLAIYQARVGNQYGHPHQETLDRLASAGVPVFGTGAAGGTVVVSTACDDQFSVAPQFGAFPLVPSQAPSPSIAQPPAPTAAASTQTPAPTQVP